MSNNTSPDNETTTDRWISAIKTNRFFAVIFLIFLFVVGIGSLAEGIEKIINCTKKTFQKKEMTKHEEAASKKNIDLSNSHLGIMNDLCDIAQSFVLNTDNIHNAPYTEKAMDKKLDDIVDEFVDKFNSKAQEPYNYNINQDEELNREQLNFTADLLQESLRWHYLRRKILLNIRNEKPNDNLIVVMQQSYRELQRSCPDLD